MITSKENLNEYLLLEMEAKYLKAKIDWSYLKEESGEIDKNWANDKSKKWKDFKINKAISRVK